MKYETPELMALTPAIDAIQGSKPQSGNHDSGFPEIGTAAYEDWE